MSDDLPFGPETRQYPSAWTTYRSMSETDVAYFAGLLDGEGYVGITPVRRQSGQRGYRASIAIGMTDERPISWLSKTCGGNYCGYETNPLHKRVYLWTCWDRNAVPLLKLAMPHLLVKSEQALVLIEFAETLRTYRGGRYQPLSDEVLDTRQRLYERSRSLNKRGPS